MSSPLPKNKPLCEKPKRPYIPSHPALAPEGVSRSPRHVARAAMDEGRAARRAAGSRTVKPRGPGTSTLVSSCAERFAQRRRLTSPTLRGERGAAVKPLRRECRSDFGVPVLACVRLFCFARKAVGAFVHPAFPAPSDFGGPPTMHHSGVSRRGNAYLCLPP
jgi:hypothetical protein